MVLASHVIFSAYGFWLPNDPRGSWSDFVYAWELFRFGPATKVTTRRSVAARPHNRAARLAAKEALTYPAVQFTGLQALSVARAFQRVIHDYTYLVYACSILPEHVHMVIARHHYDVEQVVRALKQAATEKLVEDRLHPLARYRTRDGKPPTPWARKCWHVFLDDPADIHRAVAYVERNPEKEGKKPQHWSFTTDPTTVDLRSTAKQALLKAKTCRSTPPV
jgi:REP element-mobilizing transposase RayT